MSSSVQTQRRCARIAGFAYLLVIALYVAAHVLTGRLEVDGNFVATAQQIAAHESAYRFGLYCLVAEQLVTLVLALGLYGAVRPAEPELALAGLSFRMIEVAAGAVVAGLSFATLTLHMTGTSGGQDARVWRALSDTLNQTNGAAINVAGSFFGIGSCLFFYGFVKSGLIPKVIAWYGLLASLIVAPLCAAELVAPGWSQWLDHGWEVMGLAEIVTGVWLLVKGVRVPERVAVTS